MTKSVKTLRMTRLRRRVVQRARSWGGASNIPFTRFHKSCFTKNLQVQIAYVLCFSKLSQICICRNTQVSHAFANMARISQALASIRANRFRRVSQYFASFRNLWFRKLLQGFTRFRKWTFARIRKCENHGFSQGFTGTMGTLLMEKIVVSVQNKRFLFEQKNIEQHKTAPSQAKSSLNTP